MKYHITDKGIRVEFKIDLKAVRPNEAAKYKTVQKEPRLRRSLILAHQLAALFAQGKAESFAQAGEWLGVSTARINQLLNLLLLSPRIQEELLMGDGDERLRSVTENSVRDITRRTDWKEQQSQWQQLISRDTERK